MNQTKKSYQTPRLTIHGDAAQLTQETASGSRLDRVLGSPVPANGLIATS